jgi:hypothetical protein
MLTLAAVVIILSKSATFGFAKIFANYVYGEKPKENGGAKRRHSLLVLATTKKRACICRLFFMISKRVA